MSAADLYAGHAVEGFYTDEAGLPDNFPAGVWTSAHSTANSGTPRNSSSPTVAPPGCNDDLDCDDGLYCTVSDTCYSGGCGGDPRDMDRDRRCPDA